MEWWQILLLSTALIFAALSLLLWLWNVLRAKKMRSPDFVSTDKNKPGKFKVPIKLDKLIFILGGIENITAASATNNKLKVMITNHDKVDINSLKKIKNRGIFEQSDSISIVIGYSANFLSNSINELITLRNNQKNEV